MSTVLLLNLSYIERGSSALQRTMQCFKNDAKYECISYCGIRSFNQTMLINSVETFLNITHNISPSKPLRLEHIIHIIILQKQTKPYSSRLLVSLYYWNKGIV